MGENSKIDELVAKRDEYMKLLSNAKDSTTRGKLKRSIDKINDDIRAMRQAIVTSDDIMCNLIDAYDRVIKNGESQESVIMESVRREILNVQESQMSKEMRELMTTKKLINRMNQIMCPLCSLKASEIQYIKGNSRMNKCTPEAYVVEHEITYSPEHELFICRECGRNSKLEESVIKELFDKYREIVEPLAQELK